MSISDVICVTNRIICENNGESFLERIRKVAETHPHAIILREKDLSLDEYAALADQVAAICRKTGTRLIIHQFYELIVDSETYKPFNVNINNTTADEQDIFKSGNYEYLHMPLNKLEELYKNHPVTYKMLRFRLLGLGASCHSVEDAKLAEKLGCTYIIAGHIYNTDCKKGLEGRGTDFLKSVVDAVQIPVYAIGGITPGNYTEIKSAGASGACIMSSAMTCESPELLLDNFKD